MHKSYTNTKNPQDLDQRWSEFKWELFPYSFAVIGLATSSGCTGLHAWLEYNESKVRGCIDVPVYTGLPIPQEDAAMSQDFCLQTSEGGVRPTP
jgi:hypothetical protein